MINDLFYLGFLILGGVKDLRHHEIKHWQIFLFCLFIFQQIIWSPWPIFSLINFFFVLIITLSGYLYKLIGAADVKIISLSALYNFYFTDPWLIWLAGLLTAIIDIVLWILYFRQRNQPSPLIFSWMLTNLLIFIINPH